MSLTQGRYSWRVVYGLALVGVPLFSFGLLLHSAWQAGNEAISGELERYDRLRAIAAYRQALDSAGAEIDEKAYGDLFLKEGTVAVVSAGLLTQLKQMAATQGIEIMRAGDLEPRIDDPVSLVGGSLEMSGTLSSIYGFIQQIETAKPLLFIDRLDIRSNGSTGADDSTDARLMVQIRVYGAIHSSTLAAIGLVPDAN